jgi:poly(3-hydroxybutyrate) depolymerase
LTEALICKMNSLVRASKEILKAGTRGFAATATPDRKVAVLGAAGEPDPDYFDGCCDCNPPDLILWTAIAAAFCFHVPFCLVRGGDVVLAAPAAAAAPVGS